MDAATERFRRLIAEANMGDLDAWFRSEEPTTRDRTLEEVVQLYLGTPAAERGEIEKTVGKLEYLRLLEDFAARMMRRAAKERSPFPLVEALRALIVHNFRTREAEMVLAEIFDVARLKVGIDGERLLEMVREYATGRALQLIETAAHELH